MIDITKEEYLGNEAARQECTDWLYKGTHLSPSSIKARHDKIATAVLLDKTWKLREVILQIGEKFAFLWKVIK